MAFSTNGSEGLSSEINITPLIDVLLVLLIIFMVIVPLAPAGLQAALPAAAPHEKSAPAEAPVVVQIGVEDGSPVYRMDGFRVETSDLEIRIREAMARRANRQMLIQAAGQLDFGTVSRVVDLGHIAGVEAVGLLTPGASKEADSAHTP